MGVIQVGRSPKGSVLNRQVLAVGDRVFREGSPGDTAYIVQSGAVEIFKCKGDTEVVLGTVAEGGIFGEMALIDGEPRMASARAVAPTTLIVIGRNAFAAKMKDADPMVAGVIRLLARNIRRLTDATLGRSHAA